jgi:hypothetical protein
VAVSMRLRRDHEASMSTVARKRGPIRSCECPKREVAGSLGHAGLRTRTYKSWEAMKRRCIARSLDARGIATVRGGEWTAVQVGSILRRVYGER